MTSLILPGQVESTPKADNSNIPQARRIRMLALIDGIPTLAILMEHLNRYDRCDQILAWCWERQMKGLKLLEFYQECGGSPLIVSKRILARIEGSPRELKPVIAGRDWR